MRLSIQAARRTLRPRTNQRQLQRWARTALQQDADLTLRFVSPNEARRLNRSFRGANYASNVLTFGYDDPAQVRADIVICMAVVARQARQQRKSLSDHLAHMVIHGVLHAQGWDHEIRTEARVMETLETRLLRRLQIGNPY